MSVQHALCDMIYLAQRVAFVLRVIDQTFLLNVTDRIAHRLHQRCCVLPTQSGCVAGTHVPVATCLNDDLKGITLMDGVHRDVAQGAPGEYCGDDHNNHQRTLAWLGLWCQRTLLD